MKVKDAGEFAARALDVLLDVIAAKPGALVGLPTGQTPLAFYHLLVEQRERLASTLASVTWVTLDEYLGASPEDDVSLIGWLKRACLDRLGVPPERLLRIDAAAANPEEACQRFEDALAARGGLDLLYLGIGANGHIGFNEPGSPAISRTRVVKLTETSRAANARYWPEGARVPEYGVTMGVGTILQARRIVLLALGEAKADIVREALHGPITEEVPASLLRRAAGRVTVIADEAACRRL